MNKEVNRLGFQSRHCFFKHFIPFIKNNSQKIDSFIFGIYNIFLKSSLFSKSHLCIS